LPIVSAEGYTLSVRPDDAGPYGCADLPRAGHEHSAPHNERRESPELEVIFSLARSPDVAKYDYSPDLEQKAADIVAPPAGSLVGDRRCLDE
jgi:hypothetical protein